MAAAGLIDAFTLPARLEAAEPPEVRGLTRDAVRMLVSSADSDTIAHSRFSDLPQWLSPGDLLVVNTSGTLKAALTARTRTGHRLPSALPPMRQAGFRAARWQREPPRRMYREPSPQ